MTKKSVCILIPAYNEEEIIGETIKHLLSFFNKNNIYVVDDGSNDKTAEITKKLLKNVITIKNGGKANALNQGIKEFNLVDKYKYITPTDADSELSSDFFDNIIPIFEKDIKKNIAGVVGKVVGKPTNWITTYRMWEYEMAQIIHKSAQSKINAIVVCPGPCTVLRSELFSKVQYPSGTLTEDMDLTFLIHRKHLGKLIFQSESTSKTQDPNKLKSYSNQLKRWYSGFWQCLSKHEVPKHHQKLDLEASMLALEGIFNGLFVLSLFFTIPYLLFANYTIVLWALVADLTIFMIPSLTYVANKYNYWKIYLYIPHFYFLRIYGGLIFIFSYGIVVTGSDRNSANSWDTIRYKTNLNN